MNALLNVLEVIWAIFKFFVAYAFAFLGVIAGLWIVRVVVALVTPGVVI